MPAVSTVPPPPAHVHVQGICGTAMGAFAGMLLDQGYRVTGSDQNVYPPMSDYLAGLGIPIQQGFVAANLHPAPDLVVVGNVMRASYEESVAMVEADLPYTSMPAMLGARWLEQAHSVVVCGTHGKTTTTAVTAWLLEAGGLKPGFLIGGVAGNFDRTARSGGGSWFVVEGDEYDTAWFDKRPKFVHYRPRTAILTSVEFDHADIYADLEAVKASFRTLVGLVPEGGALVARWDEGNVRDVVHEVGAGFRGELVRYGPSQDWDGRIEGVDPTAGTMRFTVLHRGRAIGTFESVMVGTHNLHNQVAATAVAVRAGLSPEQIAEGFRTFRGIKRRQEVRGEVARITVIDDFAHHPTAVKVTLEALRQRFGGRRLWAIFEPRSATSRRDVFQQAYAEAFDAADLVVIAPPYDTSRIAEDERFDTDRLVAALLARGREASTWPDVASIVAVVAARAHPADVVAVLSNGGFGGLHDKLLAALRERFPDPGTT